ncbi:MAG: P-type ATPase, partial [Myxococcaceae bacterium]|nr:P-type ATPase [Myxococcaceae bacterium]
MLVEQGLTRYYTLARDEVAPVSLSPGRSLAWLEPLVEQVALNPGQLKTLELDVQGIHCAACVWLFNETFRRKGGAAITVNPALGRVRLQWEPRQVELSGWVREIEAFGYVLGPASKQGLAASSELPMRLGISAAITLNVMLFSVSFYFGLAPADGELFAIFSTLSLLLSTAVVVIGGWPFFRGAVRGLKSGVLHLDLPIALGILLVWGTSVAQAAGPGGDSAYFDTLNVFITLMLLGRWLQQRVLERNRRFLLEDDGAEGLFVRRRSGTRIEVVAAPKIRTGDELLIAPGELIPVDARVAAGALVSTDWITGESAPRQLEAQQVAPAGSFNAGRTALGAIAVTDYSQSALVALLRLPPSREGAPAPHLQFWHRL